MTDEEWTAIKTRNHEYDDQFVYGVSTTKIVCRPSCSTRLANPSHIVIFPTFKIAEMHGYRPCFRCRPDLPTWKGAKKELTEQAQKYIQQHYTEKFSLPQLSQTLYVNACYLVRVFHETTGETPLSYHHRLRCQEAKKLLRSNEYSIAYIATIVGYASASHFSRVFKKYIHSTPHIYRLTHTRKKK
ncbi:MULTISPECIES: Ada metal-binding domain-containing protein [Megasphaera]|jgi:hypothetical protein|uniref:AraC family transcriptional regulator n=1 Tax=Megasphaera hutchinsoni TaxID=1588748 RepID=A0A134CI83_9FIRM|nr:MULTISPECIES: Ada metal-binding domain-containing protein [Megasphaera]EGS35676.1 transcriptional regulator, AraC family [Megasphaera sp. UPII 135-E]KXB91913.1 transcriptional regulator, AraC family [Megasphaera hutchinsoni]MUP48244.1 AraC family transcriptional regulator [Veillonellaceae bacterium M2-8]PNH21742.1 AraC family transcriptional regulator [Megasphaera genomosp. type_2]